MYTRELSFLNAILSKPISIIYHEILIIITIFEVSKISYN
jgi:hypothetical protein